MILHWTENDLFSHSSTYRILLHVSMKMSNNSLDVTGWEGVYWWRGVCGQAREVSSERLLLSGVFSLLSSGRIIVESSNLSMHIQLLQEAVQGTASQRLLWLWQQCLPQSQLAPAWPWPWQHRQWAGPSTGVHISWRNLWEVELLLWFRLPYASPSKNVYQ